MRFSAVAILLGVLLAPSTGAVDFSLTEGAAVELAVDRNLSLSSSRLLLEAKRIAADNAAGTFVPSLSLSAGISRSNQETSVPLPGSPYYWTGSAGLGLAMSLSAASIQGIRTTRLDYQAGRISYRQAQDAITLQVRTSFYRLILLEKQLGVTEASIATAEQTLQQARTDYANGRVQRLTVRQAELSVQSAKLVLERQKVQYENTLASFKNLLGISPDKSVQISGTLEVSPLPILAGVHNATVEERPDIRAVTAQIALQGSKNRATFLSMVTPTLTLSASISPSFPDPLNFDNPPGSSWNDRGSISVSLSASSLLAFLPFVPQNVELRKGETTLHSLEVQKAELAASARTEIDSFIRSLAASEAAIASLRASVTLAQESYDLTKEAYGLGTVDFLTLKSAEDDLLKARYEVLSEEYTYLTTLIQLEYATGQDLRSRKE